MTIAIALVLGVALGGLGMWLMMRRRAGLTEQIQWFQNARQAIADFQLVASRGARLIEDDEEIPPELYDNLRNRADQLVVTLAGAEVYCSPEFCDKVRSLVVDIYMVAKKEDNPWSYMAETAHITAGVLINQIREDQKLEALSPAWEGIRTPVRPLWRFPERNPSS